MRMLTIWEIYLVGINCLIRLNMEYMKNKVGFAFIFLTLHQTILSEVEKQRKLYNIYLFIYSCNYRIL